MTTYGVVLANALVPPGQFPSTAIKVAAVLSMVGGVRPGFPPTE